MTEYRRVVETIHRITAIKQGRIFLYGTSDHPAMCLPISQKSHILAAVGQTGSPSYLGDGIPAIKLVPPVETTFLVDHNGEKVGFVVPEVIHMLPEGFRPPEED